MFIEKKIMIALEKYEIFGAVGNRRLEQLKTQDEQFENKGPQQTSFFFKNYKSIGDIIYRIISIVTYPLLCGVIAITSPVEGCFHLGWAVSALIMQDYQCAIINFSKALWFIIFAPFLLLLKAPISCVLNLIDAIGSIFTTVFPSNFDLDEEFLDSDSEEVVFFEDLNEEISVKYSRVTKTNDYRIFGVSGECSRKIYEASKEKYSINYVEIITSSFFQPYDSATDIFFRTIAVFACPLAFAGSLFINPFIGLFYLSMAIISLVMQDYPEAIENFQQGLKRLIVSQIFALLAIPLSFSLNLLDAIVSIFTSVLPNSSAPDNVCYTSNFVC